MYGLFHLMGESCFNAKPIGNMSHTRRGLECTLISKVLAKVHRKDEWGFVTHTHIHIYKDIFGFNV